MATDLLTAERSSSADHPRGRSMSTSSNFGGAGQGSAVAIDGVAATGVQATAESAASADPLSVLLSDLIQLTKPRIVVMILVTTVATAMLGAGGAVDPLTLLWLLLATAGVAASAGAANQIWERVIDCRMTRTASRPLPSGRMQTIPAIWYTALLGGAGTLLLHFKFGPVPAAVGAVTWLLYVLVYTPMKTRTSWNTTVGAIAGALPVLIGYTATGGSLMDATGWLLVGVLVAWQYPHFMSIAWMYRRQYSEAGFCMTTTVEPTGRSAGLQSVAGSVALIACAAWLCWLSDGTISALIATVAVTASTLPMLRASIRFLESPGDPPARKLLRSSLLVLPAVLAIVTLRLFW